MGNEHSNQPPGAERPKRRMVLRKIAPDGTAQMATPSPALSVPAPSLKVRPRMPSASELPRIPRQAMAAEFAEMKRMAEVAQAGRPMSTTVRPPPPPDSDPAPIPLTRLHTPRPRFRSAIDFPAHASGAGDEARVRETSSTSLPPLVATLPPPAAPIYLPAGLSSGNRRRAMAMARSGALLLGALALIVAGVAMGRRLDQPQPATESGSTGSAATQKDGVVHVLAAGGAAPYRQVGDPEQQQQPVAVVVAPPSAPAAAPLVEATLAVESLPIAAAAAPARVAAPPVPALPAPAAPPRPAAPQAAVAPPTPPASAAPAIPPIRSTEKGPSPSDDTAAATSPPAAPVAAPHHEAANEDPLVKAVRADIEEEEARRK
jgi:hypothetical protein